MQLLMTEIYIVAFYEWAQNLKNVTRVTMELPIGFKFG